MSEISAKLVYTLREMTGAPMMRCKAALSAVGGDLVRAESLLREQGMKPSPVDKVGNQGFIAVYMHPGNQTVGLVELACATDFVARSTEFRTVANELAMQVAASAPIAISVNDLPEELRENEIRIAGVRLESAPKLAGKLESLREQIARDKAQKAMEEKCLLTQAYIRDPKIKVGSLIDDLTLKVREGIYVRRMARWRVGEAL